MKIKIKEKLNNIFWGLPFSEKYLEYFHGVYRRVCYRIPMMSNVLESFFASYQNNTRSSAHYESSPEVIVRQNIDPVLIAYYLPQFYRNDFNDRWWGEGVTEWNNVSRALPQFAGHRQPRVPSTLGYYNLLCPNVFGQQDKMANECGIGAFCFYFYFFESNKSLLREPIDLYQNLKNVKTPFCLCWANESWTRRFDGISNDILMSQDHTFDFYLNAICEFENYLISKNYLSIDGAPVFLVYRPEKIPHCKEILSSWRQSFYSKFKLNLHLVGVKDFSSDIDLLDLGFDAYTEFQPRRIMLDQQVTNSSEQLFNPKFSGKVYDYLDVLNERLVNKYAACGYYQAVACGWDNTPRRIDSGVVYKNCTPETYENWLKITINSSRLHNSKNIVFINAWNEWGEGAYLEPDSYYGYAFLNATKRAVEAARLC